MNRNITDWTAAAAFVLVLGVSSLWGEYQRADMAREKAETFQEKAQERERALEQQERSPALSGEERKALEEIASALGKKNLKEAAGVMNREEELLAGLFYETMAGRRYLYDGAALNEEIEGEGLVLTKAGTVFYGAFEGGRPQGQCLALQVVELDAPRYDYSDGLWQNGVMEGRGHTGYCYYERSPVGEARDVCRRGQFSGNLMEGRIAYITTNEKGEESLWEFDVEAGVTVLDDSWTYLSSLEEYQLISVDNDHHAYVLGEDQARQPMWANTLLWDE
ncbi:MAG: hypothetical protein LIP16_09150 [Clostridium sp.]|nr:hypothetical protein [Clostridium sp.]